MTTAPEKPTAFAELNELVQDMKPLEATNFLLEYLSNIEQYWPDLEREYIIAECGLTIIESRYFRALHANMGKPVKSHIFKEMHPPHASAGRLNVSNGMSRLRKRIGQLGYTIEAKHSVGYTLRKAQP